MYPAACTATTPRPGQPKPAPAAAAGAGARRTVFEQHRARTPDGQALQAGSEGTEAAGGSQAVL